MDLILHLNSPLGLLGQGTAPHGRVALVLSGGHGVCSHGVWWPRRSPATAPPFGGAISLPVCFISCLLGLYLELHAIGKLGTNLSHAFECHKSIFYFISLQSISFQQKQTRIWKTNLGLPKGKDWGGIN